MYLFEVGGWVISELWKIWCFCKNSQNCTTFPFVACTQPQNNWYSFIFPILVPVLLWHTHVKYRSGRKNILFGNNFLNLRTIWDASSFPEELICFVKYTGPQMNLHLHHHNYLTRNITIARKIARTIVLHVWVDHLWTKAISTFHEEVAYPTYHFTSYSLIPTTPSLMLHTPCVCNIWRK